MTKREARKHALNHAAGILESTVDGGWPFDMADAGEWSEEDCTKVQAALMEVAWALAGRFSRLVLADVRRDRSIREKA